MEEKLRQVLMEIFQKSTNKTIQIEELTTRSIRSLFSYSDFEFDDYLLIVLEKLAQEKFLKLPSRNSKTNWNPKTKLPENITLIREEEEKRKTEKQTLLENLRNRTAWEPTKMIAFASSLKTQVELERAVTVNQYLKQRKPDTEKLPHRERALQIFGYEKALDSFLHQGLFGGKVQLADLDCFYCPEPLPFQPLSLNVEETRNKPLLVVENSNTYWSCCQANDQTRTFAAVIYGKGFQVSKGEQSANSLQMLEAQWQAQGIFYFGDLDPTGLFIPQKMDQYRKKQELSPIFPCLPLYQKLLEQEVTTPYERSQAKHHDPEWARQWLGKALASTYLQQAVTARWPQEALTQREIQLAFQSF